MMVCWVHLFLLGGSSCPLSSKAALITFNVMSWEASGVNLMKLLPLFCSNSFKMRN